MDDLGWLIIIGIAILLLSRKQGSQQTGAEQGFHNEQTLTWVDWRGNQRWMRVTRDVRPH